MALRCDRSARRGLLPRTLAWVAVGLALVLPPAAPQIGPQPAVDAVALASAFPQWSIQDHTEEPQPELKPVRIVVLVDESGSLTEEDVAREKEAAQLIVRSELSPESTVSVLGFASSDGPGQAAIDPVCGPGRLSTDREQIADCIDSIQRRGPDQGDDTDHVAALRAALTDLRNGTEPKIVFLLTDGKLAVPDSTEYGSNPARRTEAARALLPSVLRELKSTNVQIWPLGFGADQDLDEGQLREFAAGGAPATCPAQTPQPRETVVRESAELLQAIRDAVTAARCVNPDDITIGQDCPGCTAELSVDISPIATDGSILVFKRNPQTTVVYKDPMDREVPKTGTLDGSEFSVGGDSTEVEALRIVNPLPGRWTVVLRAPATSPQNDVAVTVIFQGAVHAVLNIDPQTPQPGQVVDVTLRLLTRRGYVSDPVLLDDLTFTASMSGAGFGTVPVALGNDDRDGLYTGQVPVPAEASGALRFTGTVTGLGISGDERVQNTKVREGLPELEAQLRLLDDGGPVEPGAMVRGEAVITNHTGQPAAVRLLVVDASPQTTIRAEPAELAVEASAQGRRHEFTLHFPTDTARGPNGATLQLVGADGGTIKQLPFERTVEDPPGIVERFLWLGLLLAALLAGLLVFLLVKRQAAKEGREVGGLRVELQRGGFGAATLTPPDPSAEVFRFVLRNDFAGPQLEHAHSTDAAVFELRRGKATLSLTPAAGPQGTAIQPGGRRELGDDLVLVVYDDRATSSGTPLVGAGLGGSAGGWDPFAGVGPGSTASFDGGPGGSQPGYPTTADQPTQSYPTSPYPPPPRPDDPPPGGGWRDPNEYWR